jgi:hypothetical protein
MTVSAEQIELFAIPLADPPAVNAQFPVPVNAPMALSAQPMGFLKRDLFPVYQPEKISFFGIVAVEAPKDLSGMLQVDFSVHMEKNPRLGVRSMDIRSQKRIAFFELAADSTYVTSMAGLAGVYSLVHQGGWHWITVHLFRFLTYRINLLLPLFSTCRHVNGSK